MFDEKYKSEKCLWGKEPIKSVKSILKYKNSGDVLDMGVGEGRNSIFLAKQGFNVTGVDISKEAIEKFKRIADGENLKVEGIREDIRNFKFNKKYDVIISATTLHFLDEKSIKKIIEKMKAHTKLNGINLITVFTEENPHKNFSHLFKKGELKSYYPDWKIIGYKEIITPVEKHGLALIFAIRTS